MNILDKIKSLLVTDDQLIARSKGKNADSGNGKCALMVPNPLTEESLYAALVQYGQAAGYIDPNREPNPTSQALLSSIRNQTVKMHEEILNYYRKQNQTPDEKMLNRLTCENMFYLSMGTAILAKVKKTNLIAQGFFGKLLRKSGPEYFYREVAAMAGHKYGAEPVEELHAHVQRAVIKVLTSIDTLPNARELTIETAKALYMYGLAVTLKLKAES